MILEHTKEYLEGRYAAIQGKSTSDCPYVPESIAAQWWIAGFFSKRDNRKRQGLHGR